MTTPSDTATPADINTALLLLERLGLTPQQLLRPTASSRPVPTFNDYIDRVAAALPSGTRRVYTPYWKRIQAAWGHRRLDEPNALEIQQLAESTRTNATVRRNSRGGRSAAEHLIASLRCVYRYAVADGLIAETDNPAIKVAKPRRLPSTRHALPDHRLAEINQIAATTGNDPALDSLLLRLHTETACRRGGALSLRPSRLDTEQCLVLLHEKGDTFRYQPVSPTLMHHLIEHYEKRGNDNPEEQLLRFHNGRPLTTRRYDYLWRRIGQHVPWVANQGVSTHWLRHTTLTWVERHFGYAVARAYAGHNGKNDTGSTSTYIRADIHEVAVALATLTGEDHPTATRRGNGDLTYEVFM